MNKHHASLSHSRIHGPRAWVLGVLLGLQSMAVQAQGTAPPPAPAPAGCDIVVAGQSIDAALAVFRGLERQCHKHAPFLYRWGQLLNQAGQYEAAIDPLEGAILYGPQHWPSQLEYAIALEGSGDHESALNLIQALLQLPEVDPAVKEQLLALQNRPAQARRPGARRVFSLATGYDSNLLGSTHHTEFTLTTPDGPLPVTLLQDQRPRSGAFARAELTVDGVLANNEYTVLRYSLAGSYRANAGLASANRLQVAAFVEASASSGKGPYLLAQHQSLLINEAATLRQNQLGLGIDLPLGNAGSCQQRLGVDVQHLAYPINPLLGGRYTGLVGTSTCPAWGGQLLLRVGEDRPADSARPGGTQRQTSLRISKRSLLAGGSLAVEWEGTRQLDRAGYSVLLSNNARRQITRHAYRLEFSWQFGGFSPYLGVEWVEQGSNLRLFEFKNWVTTLGLRSAW